MEKFTTSIVINASREKVWDTMLGDATYREWTAAFNPGGSWYEGSWEEGSDIRFIGPGEGDQVGGMISRIKESRKPEFVSIEHLGFLKDGVEDFDSPEVQAFKGALENYTFNEVDGGTKVVVEMHLGTTEMKMFEESWPKALEKLKEIAER